MLVSAGAGSGKTRVLTDRIISKLLDEKNGAQITEFLVVTFTKAAAKELSDRIRVSLVKKSEQTEKNENIIKNLALLPQAKICTIDAFCYDLVKSNFQKLGISPKTRIADENETDVIIDRIFTEIIEERMMSQEGHEYFLPLYETLSDKKSDRAFLKSLKELYKKISNNLNVKKYFSDVCEMYDEINEKEEVFLTRYGKMLREYTENLLSEARKYVYDAMSECEDDAELRKLIMPALENESERLKIFFSSLSTAYDDVCYSFSALKTTPVNLKKAPDPEKAASVRDKCQKSRDIVNYLKNEFYSVSSETLKKCAKDCANLTKELADIMLEFDARFMKEKREYGILNFSDVEKLALKILYDDEKMTVESELAKTLQKTFTELYIDEYQDTNRIQDMIFRALTNKDGEKKENNRFMVGDSKQSIYGFRGARPDIFNEYKEIFDDYESNSGRKKIFMNDNFRCSENIINFTNALFEKAMPEEYGKEECLNYAKIEDKIKINEPVKLFLCTGEDGKTDIASGSNLQAERIYEEICSLYNNENILSCEGKPYKYEDMAILTQRWKDARFLEKFFSEKKIPVSCEKGENFFDRREVNAVLAILGAVDNPERDVCVAGFMRSKAGGFDDNELARIRRNTPDGSFYHAVKEYKESGENVELRAKISEFCEKLTLFRKLSRTSKVSDFIKTLYSKTDILSVCTSKAYENGINDTKEVRKRNLLMLYDIARNYDKTVFKGLSSFLEYLDSMKKSDDVKSCTAADSDRIKIMTIHKSKGLEFPVCFVFGADRTAFRPIDKLIYFDKNDKIGIGFNLKNLDKMESVKGNSGNTQIATPFRKLFSEFEYADELLEAKRLMYVAFTRAKERLIITASPKNLSNALKNRQKSDIDCKSQLDHILSAFSDEKTLCSLDGSISETENKYDFLEISAQTRILTEKSEENIKKEREKTDFSADSELLETVKDMINKRNGAIRKIASIPPKLTVSLLKNGLIDYDEAGFQTISERKLMTEPEYVSETKEKTSAEKGTAMHMFMQVANYKECE